MEKKHATNGKFKAFLKKNVYYIIMGVCILAIAAMITVALVTKNNADEVVDVGNIVDNNINNGDDEPKQPDNNPDQKPSDNKPTAVVFASPVAEINISKEYCMDTLVWNETLKHFAVHNGIDFVGEDGTAVMSAYAGTVSKITYDVLNGYTVTIKHNDKLTTTYSSLNEPTVTVGQTVVKGEKIGTMGVTATNECLDGAHVHFCLYENGKIADPSNYLSLGEK